MLQFISNTQALVYYCIIRNTTVKARKSSLKLARLKSQTIRSSILSLHPWLTDFPEVDSVWCAFAVMYLISTANSSGIEMGFCPYIFIFPRSLHAENSTSAVLGSAAINTYPEWEVDAEIYKNAAILWDLPKFRGVNSESYLSNCPSMHNEGRS